MGNAEMKATVLRPYLPPDAQWSGQSGLAELRIGDVLYHLDYSMSCGLSVLRSGDFSGKYGGGWCGINYGGDQLRPGYHGDSGWVDVPATAADRAVRQWAERHYLALFGIGPEPETDRTPYHKPSGA